MDKTNPLNLPHQQPELEKIFGRNEELAKDPRVVKALSKIFATYFLRNKPKNTMELGMKCAKIIMDAENQINLNLRRYQRLAEKALNAYIDQTSASNERDLSLYAEVKMKDCCTIL